MERYAHRGLHGNDVAENTMKAFENAVEAGIGIELDVRLTADGKLAVFHDSTLKRLVKGDNRAISTLTADELKEVRLKDGSQIPMLFEVLELVEGKVPLLIEIKTQSKVLSSLRTEKALIEELKGYTGEYRVQSFNAMAVNYCRRHLKAESGRLSGDMYSCRRCGDFVSYKLSQLTREKVKRFREKGLKIYGWGVYDESKAEKLAEELGIDGIII